MGREKRDFVCFECKKPGHIKYDCPLWKSESKTRKKKAMMVTWSESEESSEEENEKEVANMCFMAIDELDEVNSNFSDEDMCIHALTYPVASPLSLTWYITTLSFI